MDKTKKLKDLVRLIKDSEGTYNRRHGKNKECRYDKECYRLSTKTGPHNLHESIYLVNYSGVYGDSGVSSSMHSSATEYVLKAINNRFDEIMVDAFRLMREDVVKMKEAVIEEQAEMVKTIKKIESELLEDI